MSAPDFDTDRQAAQHRGPLRGMFAVVLFALLLLGITMIWAVNQGGLPEGADTRIDDRTGNVERSGPVGPSANDDASDD